jgi:seryl-tRNA synthetase
VQNHACLASVARMEFDALVQDTQRAIESLDRQRQSALQAIEVTQRASQQDEPQRLETVIMEMELVDKLRRLEAALDHVKNEIKGVTASPSTVYRLSLQDLNAAR